MFAIDSIFRNPLLLTIVVQHLQLDLAERHLAGLAVILQRDQAFVPAHLFITVDDGGEDHAVDLLHQRVAARDDPLGRESCFYAYTSPVNSAMHANNSERRSAEIGTNSKTLVSTVLALPSLS